MTTDELNVLMQLAEMRTCNRKVKLVDVGEIEKNMNLVARGLVRKYFYRGKEEVITQLAKEGELINSSVSFLADTPSAYVIETIEPTTIVSFSRTAIFKLYEEDSKWERLGRLIITDLFLQKEIWNNTRIRLGTHERFVAFIHENPDLLQRVPQKYLASYLNMKPETFSRFKHLKKVQDA